MASLYSRTSLIALTVLMSVLICHGAGLTITKEDYESRSHSALLQSIQEFRIEETELFQKLQSVEEFSLDEVSNLKKCSCQGYTCGCCLHVKIPKIELDADVCVKVSYLPKEIGVQVQLTVDGKAVFTKKVSVKNPPAICAGVPGLKKLASLCIKFSDLSISGHQLSGCVELQARLAKVFVERVPLGCFKIPPKDENIGNFLDDSNGFQIEDMHLPSEFQQMDQLVLETNQVSLSKNCTCEKDSCKCCGLLKVDKVSATSQVEVCLKASLLPKGPGFQAELIANGNIILKANVTTTTPRALCGTWTMQVGICLVLKDLHISGGKVSGCAEVDMKMSGKTTKKASLGCFSIPAKEDDTSISLTEDSNDDQIGEMVLPMNLKPSHKLSSELFQESNGPSCSCQKDSCKCCANIKVHKAHLHAQVCFIASFLPKELGAQVEVTVNGKTLFKQKVSAQNPPPICGTVEDTVTLCLVLKDLHISGKTFQGCAEVVVKMAIITVGKFNLGCFKIPPKELDMRFEILKQLAPTLIHTLLTENDEEEEALMPFSDEGIEESKGETCSCRKNFCHCCANLKVGKIHRESKVCLKASLLQKEVGFQADVTFDKKVIFSQKVKAQNPPPLCGALNKSTKLCLVFTKLHISRGKLEGCAAVNVKMSTLTVGKVSLGCFKLPHKEFDMRLEILKQLAPTLIRTLLTENDDKEEAMILSTDVENSLEKSKCQSGNDSYSCCIKFPSFGKKRSVCLKVGFLPNTLGVDLQMLIDGKVIFHQEIKVNDPPPFCVPLPFSKSASVCLKFKNLQLHKDSASGCIEVEAKLKNKTIQKFDLGCFKIPPKAEDFLELPKCQSGKDSYSCCVEFPVMGKQQSVCLKILFLPNVLGVDLQVLFDGKVIFHQQVKVKDPPPFCIPLPFKKKVGVCLKLSNLQLHKDGVSGCVEVDAQIDKVTVKKFNLGCFKIPPKVESQDLIDFVIEEEQFN